MRLLLLVRTAELTSFSRRQAVLDLSIRFHLKTGYCHGSLRCDNILWKPNIGPSSLRLVDFARSEKSCACMEGECCEELYKLSLALHRVETYELVEARCAAERVERALAAVGEAEQELQKRARSEAELGACVIEATAQLWNLEPFRFARSSAFVREVAVCSS